MNWQWEHTEKSTNNTHKNHHQTRWGLLVRLCIMLGAGLVFLYYKKKVAATLIFVMVIVMSIMALFAESALVSLEQKSRKIAIWIAERVSWLALALVYFVFFIPGRLILFLMHKDPLERQFPGKQTSYWKNYQNIHDFSKYKKQF